MSRLALLFTTTLLLIGVLSSTGTGQRADYPWVGVWVLDLERSAPLSANVKSQRLEIEVVPEGLKYRAVNIDANGEERAREVTLPLDGSDVTLGAGQRYSFRRVDAFTFERTNKDNAGHIVSTLKTQVSRDGRVLTQTTTLPGASATAADLDVKTFIRRK